MKEHFMAKEINKLYKEYHKSKKEDLVEQASTSMRHVYYTLKEKMLKAKATNVTLSVFAAFTENSGVLNKYELEIIKNVMPEDADEENVKLQIKNALLGNTISLIKEICEFDAHLSDSVMILGLSLCAINKHMDVRQEDLLNAISSL